MRLVTLTTFAGCLLAGHALAQAPVPVPGAAPAAPVNEETKKLKGIWKCESIVYDGKEQMANPKERDALRLVAKDAEYKMYCLSDAAKQEYIRLFSGAIELDAATKTFTLTVVEGREKGKKVHGIYELTKDQLKTCYAPADQPRPTKFEAAKDSGAFVECWKAEGLKPVK